MSEKFSEEQLSQFRTIFEKWDKNGDGTITSTEMYNHYKSFRKNFEDLTDEEPKEKKVINFDEFLKNMGCILKIAEKDGGLQEQKEIFEKYDPEKSGFISMTDLRHIMSKMAEDEGEFVDIDFDKWLQGFDTNCDSKISYEEFIAMFLELALIGSLE